MSSKINKNNLSSPLYKKGEVYYEDDKLYLCDGKTFLKNQEITLDKQKHLDKEYRRRYELYIMEDGTVLDSRNINWRDVKGWSNLKEIKFHLKGKEYIVTKNKPNFKHFIRFRNGGIRKEWNESKNEFDNNIIHEWCLGWTDGDKIYMDVIDFFTGDKVNEEVRNYSDCLKHIHPEVL